MKKSLILFAIMATQGAWAITVSTGDLGPAVGYGHQGGTLDVHLATPGLLASDPASMTIWSGLWNAPNSDDVVLDLYLNGHFVMTFLSGTAYYSGPFVTVAPAIQSMLNDGDNLIRFQAQTPVSGIDYAIGRVDIEYNAVPEPATLAALSLGIATLVRRRRR